MSHSVGYYYSTFISIFIAVLGGGISILLCFSKIFKKIIANRLLSSLLIHNILCDHQFGFMPGRNTAHAMLSLVDYLINSFEDNKLTCGIFLDISNHSTQLTTKFY